MDIRWLWTLTLIYFFRSTLFIAYSSIGLGEYSLLLTLSLYKMMIIILLSASGSKVILDSAVDPDQGANGRVKSYSILSGESAPLPTPPPTIQAVPVGPPIQTAHVVGWSDFWKNFGHMSCCTKLVWDHKSKISFWNVAFSLGAGPLKILTVTLKSAHKFFKNILKVAPEAKDFP